MEHFKLKSLALLCALTLPQLANAQAKYIWTDKLGLQPQENCTVSTANSTRFFIANRNFADAKTAIRLLIQPEPFKQLAPARTLVEMLRPPEQNQRSFSRILSVPQNTPKAHLENAVFKRSEGYIKNSELQPIDDYVFEVITSSEKQFKTTFWQVVLNGRNYSTIVCDNGNEKKTYVTFNVFDTKNSSPMAQVSLATSDISILNNINVHTSVEAEKILALHHKQQQKDLKDLENTLVSPANALKQPHKLENVAIAPAKIKSFTPPAPTEKVETSKLKTVSSKPAPLKIAANKPLAIPPATEPVSNTPSSLIDHLICTEDGDLNIRNTNLDTIIFKAEKFEIVKIIQSFDGNRSASHVQVQFPGRNNRTGWAAKAYVQPKANCASYQVHLKENQSSKAASQIVKKTSGSIYSENCCLFPTTKRPLITYRTGVPSFNWRRGGGKRTHAASDLYRHNGDSVVAITDGSVIRNLYYFYQGVYALEVVHSGGQVVRYGEVLGKSIPGVSNGRKVKPGQLIARIGKTTCCDPMLHFELFSGAKKGSLSGGGKYKRRSDLMNPTEYLRRWEKKLFGTSY